jgi:hypothetical protein
MKKNLVKKEYLEKIKLYKNIINLIMMKINPL